MIRVAGRVLSLDSSAEFGIVQRVVLGTPSNSDMDLGSRELADILDKIFEMVFGCELFPALYVTRGVAVVIDNGV